MNLPSNIVYMNVFGSRIYGLETPESDWDIKGVCVLSEGELFEKLNTQLTDLPKDPDMKAINDLCVTAIKRFHK